MADEVRIAAVGAGADMLEPMGWTHYAPGDDGRWHVVRFEVNPAYRPSPPPTELERAEWDVEEAERNLADARAYLAELKASPRISR